jgi:hypothetical protein
MGAGFPANKAVLHLAALGHKRSISVIGCAGETGKP